MDSDVFWPQVLPAKAFHLILHAHSINQLQDYFAIWQIIASKNHQPVEA